MLTGESLPVTKKKGEQVFSGSTCKQGEIEAVVIATGSSTFFGKTDSMFGGQHRCNWTSSAGSFFLLKVAKYNNTVCSLQEHNMFFL